MVISLHRTGEGAQGRCNSMDSEHVAGRRERLLRSVSKSSLPLPLLLLLQIEIKQGAAFLATSAGRAQGLGQEGAKEPAHLLLAGVGAAGGRV